MEEYRVPVFSELPAQVAKKVAEGGWVKLKKGKASQPGKVTVSRTQERPLTSENVSPVSSSPAEPKSRQGFLPGDKFFSDKRSLASGEAPDFDVKSVDRDGNVLSFEKGAKKISIDTPEKFARKIGTDEGAKYDEIGKTEKKVARNNEIFSVYGRGLLDDLDAWRDTAQISEMSEEEQLTFFLRLQHLRELVSAYERKAEDSRDVSRDADEIMEYGRTIPDKCISYGQLEKIAEYEGRTYVFRESKRGAEEAERKRRAEQKRQAALKRNLKSDGSEKTGERKPRAGKPSHTQRKKDVVSGGEGVSIPSEKHASVVAEEAPVKNGTENGNGKDGPQADFEFLLTNMAAPLYADIHNAENREDISFIPFRTLGDGTKVFVEMTAENGLKEIYEKLIVTRKKSEAFELKKRWIEENNHLETEYLKKKIFAEIRAVGVEAMERIDKAPDSKALQHVGRVVRIRDLTERVFVPNDPGISANDPSGAEGIRLAIQDMIGAWRDARVSEQKKWKNFEEYFRKEFSVLITDLNKRIQDFWEKKRATFPKESRREKSGPVERVRKEKPTSTDMIDPVALEQKALQSAERYFATEAIPAIETTLQEAGVDLIWLLSDGEYNKQVLDFALQEVGVNIVTLIASYTGQLPKEKGAAFEQKIRTAAKDLLVGRVMEKISRMIESESPEGVKV